MLQQVWHNNVERIINLRAYFRCQRKKEKEERRRNGRYEYYWMILNDSVASYLFGLLRESHILITVRFFANMTPVALLSLCYSRLKDIYIYIFFFTSIVYELRKSSKDKQVWNDQWIDMRVWIIGLMCCYIYSLKWKTSTHIYIYMRAPIWIIN